MYQEEIPDGTVENQFSKNILTDRQIELVDEARNAITDNPDIFSGLR